jgi:NAD(P)-dependent dehydrogenase (short-subunit alcohol dehydrogenase family)
MASMENTDWAVILGVSSGTGAALARQVARDPGWNVFGMHRGYRQHAADEVAADVTTEGRRAVLRIGNAGTAEGVRDAVAGLRETIGAGRVRLFAHAIANASVGPLTGPRALPPEKIAKTFASMAHSFVWWAEALRAADLLAPSARLYAFGNPVTDSLADNLGAIAAAKAALEIYVRALAAELGPAGHRVNLVKFGLIDSPASKAAFAPEQWVRVAARAAANTPAGRLCTPEEVARLVATLCGPAGEWFNGATIDFTGGMVQHLLNLVHSP